MSALTAAEEDNQASETPSVAAQVPTHLAQAQPQAMQALIQAPIQAEDDIAIDDSNSAYSDEL